MHVQAMTHTKLRADRDCSRYVWSPSVLPGYPSEVTPISQEPRVRFSLPGYVALVCKAILVFEAKVHVCVRGRAEH